MKWARKTAHPMHATDAQAQPMRTTTSAAEKRPLWLGRTSRTGVGHGDRALANFVACTCVARRGGLRGEASRWIKAQFVSIQQHAMRLRQHLGTFPTKTPLFGPCWCYFGVKHGIIWSEINSSVEPLGIRGCHGYIPEDYIRALYPYPLRIRAGQAYPNCNMRKGGEDISILSDINCKIISDPYPRYYSQDTGIYRIRRLPAPAEFWLNTVDLSFSLAFRTGCSQSVVMHTYT